MRILTLLAAVLCAIPQGSPAGGVAQEARDATLVRGVTISCQTDGREWASDGFPLELDRLRELGVNWVAIHPYARIGAQGEVRWREFDREHPPEFIVRPIREAHARGMSILIVPHLAYWGGPFHSRGDIDFAPGPDRERFFADYQHWMEAIADVAHDADALCVGSELDRLIDAEAQWRAIIASVRSRTTAKLTYAANWTDFARVPFWDALDAVGVQAYFPLCDSADPDVDTLRAGWKSAIADLRAVHERTGKPVVFTEIGYTCSLAAARHPWEYGEAPAADRARAEALQERCFRAGLDCLDAQREWLRGAFLWKWFVGAAPHADFRVDTPRLRAVIAEHWRAR